MDLVGYSVPHINCSSPSLKQMCVADKEKKGQERERARDTHTENEDSKEVGDP